MWMRDADPPGERAADVARRFFDVRAQPRRCPRRAATPLRLRHALRTACGRSLREYVLDEDPGEPAFVEAVRLRFESDGHATWRFRDVEAGAEAAAGYQRQPTGRS